MLFFDTWNYDAFRLVVVACGDYLWSFSQSNRTGVSCKSYLDNLITRELQARNICCGTSHQVTV